MEATVFIIISLPSLFVRVSWNSQGRCARYPFPANRILARTKENARMQMIIPPTPASAPKATPEPTAKTRDPEEHPPFQFHSTTAKTEDAQPSTTTTLTHASAKPTSPETTAISRCLALTKASAAKVAALTRKTSCHILALASEATPGNFATFQFHATGILVRDTVTARIYPISLLTFAFVTLGGREGIVTEV